MTHAQWGHYIVNIFWVVVSFFFHPLFAEDSHFDGVVFFKRVETTNHIVVDILFSRENVLNNGMTDDIIIYYNLDLIYSH